MRALALYVFTFCMLMMTASHAHGMVLPSVNAEQRDKLTAYLANLVAFETVTANSAGNLKALQWVESQLSGLPLNFAYYDYGGHHSLVITTRPTKKPALWLVSHIDVVPGSEKLFTPRVVEGKMYGRGAYDMKMAIVCYLLLLHELKDDLALYDIGVMLTSDEEIGGMNGVRPLLNEEGYGGGVALLPDGGFNWNFEEAAKGVLHVKIAAEGTAAHGSRPWQGDNAISHLIDALKGIESYFASQSTQYGNYFPTMNVGKIEGGTAVNQVPDYAEAMIDVRFPPPLSAQTLFAEIQNVISRYPRIRVTKIAEGSPNKADTDLPPFALFRSLAHKLYGIDIGTVQSHGSSDARFFGEKNIPVLVITCRGGDIHSEGEWVDLDDLTRFYSVMKQWVKDVSARHKL